MRRIAPVLITACLFISTTVIAQHGIKLTAHIGSGVSFFWGPGSADKADYYRNGLTFPNAVDTIENHFGRSARTGFSAGVQLDIPLKAGWAFTTSAQFEQVGSKLKSDSIVGPGGTYKINGEYTADYNFVSVNPQIQRSLTAGKTSIALHGGIDYAIKISYADNFNFIDQSGLNTSIGHSGGKPEVNDFRLTAGASMSFSKWSIDLNYKHGLSDYNKNGNGKASMRVLQLKLGYKIAGLGL